MIEKFRDIDVLRSIRALFERVQLLEGFFGATHVTISGGDFSNNVHDIDLDGGVF